MTEEILLDFLHMECVSMLDDFNDSNNKDVSKLENIGYDVGYRFIEKYTRDFNRFKDELEIIKFICKDFWSTIFGKQADALRTNNQGIYVLTDNSFRFITKISNSNQYMNSTLKYLAYSCGLIRGALSNLGINALTTAEIIAIPKIKFQIEIQNLN